MADLRPFWRYYGGKWRAAPRYPKPLHDTIIEPFAGAAGYSLRYAHLQVVLVEKYPIIAEMWRYLIGVTPAEVRRVPLVDAIGDLPAWVADGAKHLVGFCMNSAATSPRKQLSSGCRALRAQGRTMEGWTEARRELVASQVENIHHWCVIEGDYTSAPDVKATWFIDPPYNNAAGAHYVHSKLAYGELATWCGSRQGQTIVCENEGADWLPFQPFETSKAGPNSKGSKEAMFYRESRE